jgi:protein-S-isoprenylcysteine O-methyltransferase Ste14
MFIGVGYAGKEAAAPQKNSKLYQGIYNYMRHPQTLGEMLSFFGISLILNSWTLFVYSILFIPLFISYTIFEDNDLAIRFGQPYIDYTKRVGIFWKK